MDKKIFIVALCVLVLFTLSFSAAQEIDNSTVDKVMLESSNDAVLESCDAPILESSNDAVLESSDDSILESSKNAPVLKSSKVATHIDVKSNTTFDVVGDYFKIKLSNDKNKAIPNAKVTFKVNGVSYDRTTNSNGIASLQIRLNDGTYKIVTKFAGNSKYKSSSITTTIKMDNTRVVDSGLSNSEIQNIIDNAKANNVILFKGSSYSNVNLAITKSLTLLSNTGTTLTSSSSNPVITIKGNSASLTTVKGFNIKGEGDGIEIKNSNYVNILDNDITTGGNGIVAAGAKYLNVTKNNIVKNSKNGIAIADSSHVYVFNNKLANNKGDAIALAKSSDVYVHDNTISSNDGNGIDLTTTLNGVNYGQGNKNIHINKNTISKNGKEGILISNAGDNIRIGSNVISSNWGNGISIAKIGNNVMQSNVITENHEAGINFANGYAIPKSQDISYNVIHSNVAREIEAGETSYDGGSNRIAVGENWYSDKNTLCPKIKTKNIQFVVKQVGEGTFTATFYDSKGNVASLLPDRTLTYTVNGKSQTMTISGGKGVFKVNANDKDLVEAEVDYSIRDNDYDAKNTDDASQHINGNSPTYDFPTIPKYQIYEDIDNPYSDDGYIENNTGINQEEKNYQENRENPNENNGNGNGEGNGNGNGNGDGNGNGNGNNGDANNGNGKSAQGSSDNTGNSTQSQQADPSNNANSPLNDVSQSYNTDTTTSPESASQSASASSSSNSLAGGSSGDKSVVKQIVLDEEDIFKVTGISFIILLMILTVGFYYREDIKEMNSKR